MSQFERLRGDFYTPRPQVLNNFSFHDSEAYFEISERTSHTAHLVSSEDSNFVNFHYRKKLQRNKKTGRVTLLSTTHGSVHKRYNTGAIKRFASSSYA